MSMKRNAFLSTMSVIAAGAMLSCPLLAKAASVDQMEYRDQDRLRRADVRASVASFAHIEGGEVGERRALSDEERLEMRRQIDEAIRKAYGHRHQQSN